MNRNFKIQKATKRQLPIKLAITGVSGAGKTYCSLLFARDISKKRIILIDTEGGSSRNYSDIFDFDIVEFQAPYNVNDLSDFITEINNSKKYDVIIIDSLSLFWTGEGGILYEHQLKGGDFRAWGKVKFTQKKMIDKILSSNINIIATMRLKTDYAINNNNKFSVEKVGLKSEQSEDIDYEFSIVFKLDRITHEGIVEKDRTSIYEGRILNFNNGVGKDYIKWTDNINIKEEVIDIKIDEKILKKEIIENIMNLSNKYVKDKTKISDFVTRIKENLYKGIPSKELTIEQLKNLEDYIINYEYSKEYQNNKMDKEIIDEYEEYKEYENEYIENDNDDDSSY